MSHAKWIEVMSLLILGTTIEQWIEQIGKCVKEALQLAEIKQMELIMDFKLLEPTLFKQTHARRNRVYALMLYANSPTTDKMCIFYFGLHFLI